MKLYEITEELLEAANHEGEELTEDELHQRLNNLAMSFTSKAEGVTKLIKNIDAYASAADEEAKRLQAVRKSAQNRAQWLKRYLQENMQALGLTKLQAGVFRLGIQKNPPRVVVDDPGQIPMEYAEEITELRIDKAALKSALQEGQQIPGAHIEQGESLRIR
jgi:hypothetical protein